MTDVVGQRTVGRCWTRSNVGEIAKLKYMVGIVLLIAVLVFLPHWILATLARVSA